MEKNAKANFWKAIRTSNATSNYVEVVLGNSRSLSQNSPVITRPNLLLQISLQRLVAEQKGALFGL